MSTRPADGKKRWIRLVTTEVAIADIGLSI